MNTTPPKSSPSEQLSFLSGLSYLPKMPRPNTLPAKCVELLLKGARITHPEFQDKTGSWRLSAVIDVLAKLGWPIQRENISRAKKQRNIRAYWLDISFISAISAAI